MAKKKKTSVIKSKNLRQALFPDKTAVINFDPDNILSITYNPSTLYTIVEDKPDNLRSEFTLGQAANLIDKNISANGTYNASDDGADGYKKVVVNTPVGYTIDQILDRSAPIGMLDITGKTIEWMDYVFPGFKNMTRIQGTGRLGGYALWKSTGMTTCNIVLTNTSSEQCNNLFFQCTGLQTAVVRGDNVQSTGLFNGCTALQTADLQVVRVRSNYFANDNNLTTIILRNDSVVPLENTAVFNIAHFKSDGSGGALYVPSSLISDYLEASNWSTILAYANNNIVAIEGSYYETHYADGTPIGG